MDADPGAGYFHAPCWIETLVRHLPDCRGVWLTVEGPEGLLGGLAYLRDDSGRFRRLDSGPMGTAGGPLVRADLPPTERLAVARTLIDGVAAARSGLLDSGGIALNTLHEEVWGPLLAADRRFERLPSPTSVVDLGGGVEAVIAGFRKSKRNECRRAARRGVVVTITRDRRDLEAYHRLHRHATGHWGVASLPLPLLIDLVEAGPGPDGAGAFFTCVRHGDEIIGGHLNFHRGDWVVAWSGVTDPAHARQHFPSTAAILGNIEESCRRGARWLDLGASNGIASLLEFKRSFGACEVDRGWYLCEGWPRRLLRRGKRRLRRGMDGAPGLPGTRWHDGRTGQRGPR